MLPTADRVLRSKLVDVLVGPHGIDRYLELLGPQLTVHDARASVTAVERQTARSVTLRLRPNAAFRGARAGQFVRVGVEIDGVRWTRTYSPAGPERTSRRELELTVTVHPEGLVSRHLRERVRVGDTVFLGAAGGGFVLPEQRPERLVLIGGGSGITPVMAMLRTLCDEGHDGEIAFLHYARTAADLLYGAELRALVARHPRLLVRSVATREDGRRLDAPTVAALLGAAGLEAAHAAVCGPPALIETARELWPAERLLTETFAPPPLVAAGDVAEGTIRFARSGRTAPVTGGTLLEQAEAAGVDPAFGCRMGICHTCTCRKRAGAVRNLRTGAVSVEEDEDIQLCISAPAGDVALDL